MCYKQVVELLWTQLIKSNSLMRLLLEIISKIDQKIDIAPYSGENTVILKHFKDKIKPTFITLENYFYQTHQGAVEIHVI